MKTHIRNIILGALLSIGLGIPYLQAADVAISALPAGAALGGTEAIPAVQSGATVKTTPAAIETYLLDGSATTEVLANNAGAVDGDAGFTYNATTDIATLSGGLGLGGSADVFLVRAAAGVASFRNGANAQTLRITDTYTDDSNNASLELFAGAAGDWVQVRAVTNGTGADNYGIALTPTGTGAISAHVPDSTAAGGNARGTNAVDWQSTRDQATKIASGAYSVVSGGFRNTASGTSSVAAGGNANTSSGANSWIPGGMNALTRGLVGAGAYSSSQRAAQGDAQVILQPVRRTTTDATPVSLATDGTPAATTVMVLPSDSTATCQAIVTANFNNSGTINMAGWKADAIVKNDSSTMTISGGVCTSIGTADGALSAASCQLIVDGTRDSIELEATGVAATTIYWVAEVKCVQAG